MNKLVLTNIQKGNKSMRSIFNEADVLLGFIKPLTHVSQLPKPLVQQVISCEDKSKKQNICYSVSSLYNLKQLNV